MVNFIVAVCHRAASKSKASQLCVIVAAAGGLSPTDRSAPPTRNPCASKPPGLPRLGILFMQAIFRREPTNHLDA
jgi:hypothetical protein